jgi:hypothetical protein
MLLAAWLAAAAAPSFESVPSAETTDRRVLEPDRQVLMLAAETERLRQRLNIVSVRRPITRNVFEFAPKSQQKLLVSPAVLTPVASVSIAPVIKLLGVADDSIDSTPRRTVILTVDGELFLVREGEAFGGRYHVARIGADGAEIEDAADNKTFRLVLP